MNLSAQQEGFAIAAQPIFPASQAAATVGTGAVDMSKYNRVAFVGGVGTLGANATVAAWLQQANTSDGGNATAVINGTNIALSTNFTAANATFSLELVNGSQELSSTGRYVTCNMNVATNACVICCYPIGYIARNPPVTDYNTNTTGVQRIAG